MTDVTDKNEIKLIESLNEGMYPKRSKKRKAEQLEESQEKALEPEEDLGLEEAATADEQSAKRLQVQHIGGQGQAEEATTAMKNSKQVGLERTIPGPMSNGTIHQTKEPMECRTQRT